MQHLERDETYYYDYDERHVYDWYYFAIKNTTFRYQAFKNKTEKIYVDGIINIPSLIQVPFKLYS